MNSFHYIISLYRSRILPTLVVLSLGFLGFMILGSAAPNQGEPSSIRLVPEKLPFTPTEFYIAEVVDNRLNKNSVASLLPPTMAGQYGSPQVVDLDGGAAIAIKNYIKAGLATNTKLRPVVMRLKELKVTETAKGPTQVTGKADILISFEVKREGKLLHLLDYKSGANYTRTSKQKIDVEPILRKKLAESVQYLHLWMEKEAPHNEKLARELRVYFEDYKQNTEPDTLFYDPARPLSWPDFKGGPTKSGAFVASIFPGLASDSYAVVKDGVVHVKITMRVFALRPLSKVKETSKDAYTLNHEQRHFDIVKLVAEHYKQRVQPNKLTLADYDSMIKYQYLEALWEMDTLQKQYDGETNHGINRAAQARWDTRIDTELRALKVKI